MNLLFSGKVKDVYSYDDEHLLFRFSDRISAFDVSFNDVIPLKGKTLCDFAEFWFKKLNTDSHFVKRVADCDILVKKLKMIPMECVVRGYYYGSLIDRHKTGNVILDGNLQMASQLSTPLFDPTTKTKHDKPVDRTQAIQLGLVTTDQFDFLKDKSIQLYKMMSMVSQQAGFILADLKLEFGILDDNIILGDSIGPDEYRMWPIDSYAVGKVQTAFDKQILRDWLEQNGHKQQFEESRENNDTPIPPLIPHDIISQITTRYCESFARISKLGV